MGDLSHDRVGSGPATTQSRRDRIRAPPQDVLAILGGMRNDPRWELLVDSSSLAEPVVDLTILSGHQQVTDVHLVNLAASGGFLLATFDAAIPTWLAPKDRRHVCVIPT